MLRLHHHRTTPPRRALHEHPTHPHEHRNPTTHPALTRSSKPPNPHHPPHHHQKPTKISQILSHQTQQTTALQPTPQETKAVGLVWRRWFWGGVGRWVRSVRAGLVVRRAVGGWLGGGLGVGGGGAGVCGVVVGVGDGGVVGLWESGSVMVSMLVERSVGHEGAGAV